MDKNERRNSTQPTSRYTPFFHEMPQSPAWAGLSGSSVKVLMVLLAQVRMAPGKNGKSPQAKNNGDLSAGPAMMKKFGGPSKNTVTKAVQELQEAGFICQTMRGHGGNKPNLYALTCFPVSDMKNKALIRPTRIATREYLKVKQLKMESQ